MIGMHIIEGFLPLKWVIFWTIVMVPFIVLSVISIRKNYKNADGLAKLALAVAYLFVMSSIKFPSFAGSSSHLVGIGIGTLIVGVSAMPILTIIVLLFQVILLAHGGFSTLTANAFSMGVVGPFIIYGIYKLLKNKNKDIAIFLAVFIGSMAVYVSTAIQLNLVFGDLAEFLKIFALIQIPLAIFEAFVTMMFANYLSKINVKDIVEVEKHV